MTDAVAASSSSSFIVGSSREEINFNGKLIRGEGLYFARIVSLLRNEDIIISKWQWRWQCCATRNVHRIVNTVSAIAFIN